MKLNDDNCHLMVFGNTKNVTTIKIGNAEIKESYSDKLLGITFDKKLSFKQHIEDLCKKANKTLHVLPRVSYFMDPVNCYLQGHMRLKHSYQTPGTILLMYYKLYFRYFIQFTLIALRRQIYPV